MKSPFIIVFDDIADKANIAILVEVITSNFVSKKAKENLFIIVSEDKKTKEVFELVKSKINFSASIIVIELNSFYGNFFDIGTANWIKETFPIMNLSIKL